MLVGVIAGDQEGFAVFLDQASNNVLRLKTGQDYQGWVLISVKGREVTLEKNKRSTTMALPVPTIASLTDPAAAAPAMLPRPPAGTIPRMQVPGAPPPPGAAGAPSSPRSTIGAPPQGIPGDPRPLADQL
jgi:general secretion pathway protein N